MKTRPIINRTLIIFISVLALATVIMQMSSFGSTGGKKAAIEVDSTKGLKDFYKDYFLIGVAVGPNNLVGEQAELIKKHFNSLTAENAMKPGPIHPEENRYALGKCRQDCGFCPGKRIESTRTHSLLA